MASVKIPLGVDGVEYRLIPGHEDYAVGDDGSIWSFKPLYRQRTPAWRRIRPAVKENGYLYFTPVVASPEVKGGPRRKQICYVHRAVLMAFLGPCPDGMEACHNDGNPANNQLSNLRWDTKINNHANRLKHGTIVRGERHHEAKLVVADILEIRAAFAGGLDQDALASKFGVSQATISDICCRRTWKHVA